MACVQPEEKDAPSGSKKTTSVSIKPLQTSSKPKQIRKHKLVELSRSKHKKFTPENAFFCHGQPFLDLSTFYPANYVSLPPFVPHHLPYQSYICPVASFGYDTLTWPAPLTTVPLLTPAQIYPQFIPVIPTCNFANVISLGTSISPYFDDNFSIFDTGFGCSYFSPIESYSPAWSYTSNLSFSSPEESYSSGIWPNLTSETDATSSRCSSIVPESIEEISTPSPPSDPLELYLRLPVDLFPRVRMLSLDPNPIIDVFCKVPNIHDYEPWLLDLEYGVPRTPVTRPIAIYDVQYNSIHCKNTPGAIHPGFENCSHDFKSVVMFYYDCIVSAWYRGYTLLYVDVSVANYQSWLRPPMQAFGMCWP